MATVEEKMNERLQELYLEAAEHMKKVQDQGLPAPYQTRALAGKLAELIVKECMRMCEVTEMSFVTHDCDVEASGAITVKQFIAEHFGVE